MDLGLTPKIAAISFQVRPEIERISWMHFRVLSNAVFLVVPDPKERPCEPEDVVPSMTKVCIIMLVVVCENAKGAIRHKVAAALPRCDPNPPEPVDGEKAGEVIRHLARTGNDRSSSSGRSCRTSR